MFDSFETQIQPEEIIPEEYEDWLRFCADAYETSKYEKYDHFEEELGENWLDEIEASLGRDRDYFPTWAPGGCEWDEDEGCLPLAPKENGFTLEEWEQAYQEFCDAVEEDEATTEFEPGRTYWNEMAANP